MATRFLPGVYTSLNDLSQIPEGQTALTVGYVLKANKGPVNIATLVTSPTDFLAKYTFTGKPSVSDDPTYWDILKVLAQTNQMYIVRAANNPLYGGAVINHSTYYGRIISINAEAKQILFELGDATPNPGDVVTVAFDNGRPSAQYTVVSVEANTELGFSTATVKENIVGGDFLGVAVVEEMTVTTEIVEYEEVPVYKIKVMGDIGYAFEVGSTFAVTRCAEEENNKEYTVVAVESTPEATVIRVAEELVPATTGRIEIAGAQMNAAIGSPFVEGVADVPTEGKGSFTVLGVDPGEYNNHISIGIISSIDHPEELVYHKGADLGDSICIFDTIQMNVYGDGNLLETFVFSKDPNAKTIDGESLYIDNVVSGSNYIQVVNNTENDQLPESTTNRIILGGGSNGEEVSAEVLVAALNAFTDKTVSVSILGNGSSVEAESDIFQQALLEIATTRKDLVVFLNSRKSDENATLPSVRATNIVSYKKNDLASVSFYGTMYAPHVKTTDIYNNRQVKIGASSVALAGWLNIINTLNYPYAYAGPKNGQVTGVTSDWKIGDESGEAALMNDASINYVAFDSKVGRYYMQCQNTLQIANSSLRNLGAVLNVLDIKEHFQTALKEYLQLPITTSLRRDIVNTANDYLEPMSGIRFYNYAFQDVSSDMDISDNTLRYLLTLSLTAYAQKIYLVMNIVNNSFDFSILQSM